jgi:hypothetical protein
MQERLNGALVPLAFLTASLAFALSYRASDLGIAEWTQPAMIPCSMCASLAWLGLTIAALRRLGWRGALALLAAPLAIEPITMIAIAGRGH